MLTCQDKDVIPVEDNKLKTVTPPQSFLGQLVSSSEFLSYVVISEEWPSMVYTLQGFGSAPTYVARANFHFPIKLSWFGGGLFWKNLEDNFVSWNLN